LLPEVQPIISLLTDFGTRDVYAGVLHAVIAGIAPRARVIDLTHEVAPQDVVEAAFQLDAAEPYFPDGTIHVCVVDPGVGSSRRILYARTRRATFLAPDNGLLTRVLERSGWSETRAKSSPLHGLDREPTVELRSVENRALFLPVVSRTFHGRDVFAPVAARLALGLDPRELGPEVHDPARLPLRPDRALQPGAVRGEIIHIDRFGNLITNLRPGALADDVRGVRVNGLELDGPVRASYADVREGAPLMIISSTGLLEIAVSGGAAHEHFRARRGDPVEVSVQDPAGVCP
jgi:S-adenosyl-L-methionine hydrolase (adenosine-forming)